MILVDTSILVHFFRGTSCPATATFERLLRDDVPLSIPALCCQELLQGAKDDAEWKLLFSYLETQDIVTPLDPWTTHCEAARIFFDCRRVGITLRSSMDCLIAQLALERDATLIHADRDFERMKSVCTLRTMVLAK